MSNRLTIVTDFLAALKARDADKLKGLADHLTDDIVMASPMGSTSGKGKTSSRAST